MARVAIYIQTYNYERFIRQALDSVLAQTYRDFDLYIADNGSSDQTCEIVREYAKRDRRIIADFRTGNRTIINDYIQRICDSDAEYFAHVDADDWIEQDYLENCMNLIGERVDMVIGGARFHYDFNPELEEVRGWSGGDTLLERSEFGNLFPFLHQALRTHWAKLFKVDILRRYHIRMDESIRYGCDTQFMFSFMRYCRRIAITNKILYHYRIHSNGAVNIYYDDRLRDVILVDRIKRAYLKEIQGETPNNLIYMSFVTMFEAMDTLMSLVSYIRKAQRKPDAFVEMVCHPFFSQAWSSCRNFYMVDPENAHVKGSYPLLFKKFVSIVRACYGVLNENDVFSMLCVLCPPVDEFFSVDDANRLLEDNPPQKLFLYGNYSEALKELASMDHPNDFYQSLQCLLCVQMNQPCPSNVSWNIFTDKQKLFMLNICTVLKNVEKVETLLRFHDLLEVLWRNDDESALPMLPQLLIDEAEGSMPKAMPLVQTGLNLSAKLHRADYFSFFLKAEAEVLLDEKEFSKCGRKLTELEQMMPGDVDVIELRKALEEETAKTDSISI